MDRRDLEFAVKADLELHLSDVAASEIVHALVAGRMPWEHWVRARAILRDLLSASEPILLGGREGLARANLHSSTAISPEALSSALATQMAGWKLMMEASSREDLVKTTFVVGGAKYSFSTDKIRQRIDLTKQAWVSEFGDFVGAVSRTVPDFSPAPGGRDLRRQLDQFVTTIAEAIDRDASRGGVRPSVRLDAFIRVHALLHLRALRSKDRYNATKNVNDVFDHYLLRYLAVPVAVCTDDRGIFADVDAAGSWQRKWIARPSDLGRPEVLEAFSGMQWPSAA